jgi:small conductance mechanosensitive channel
VPNGAIGVVSNYTRDFARVNVEVRVAYGEDIARVNKIVERVAQEMAKDQEIRPLLIDLPKPGRVESVGDAGVTLSVTAQARPSARWDVAAEIRRRLAEAFLKEGIRVPFASVAPDSVTGRQTDA